MTSGTEWIATATCSFRSVDAHVRDGRFSTAIPVEVS